MIAGPWGCRNDFEAWWMANVVAFNRLAVTDPEEWERIARAIDAFQETVAKSSARTD